MAEPSKGDMRIIRLLAKKHTREILFCLNKSFKNTVRYNELRKKFNYNDKTLLRRLKEMKELNIITRFVDAENFVCYKLSKCAHDLFNFYEDTEDWERKNISE